MMRGSPCLHHTLQRGHVRAQSGAVDIAAIAPKLKGLMLNAAQALTPAQPFGVEALGQIFAVPLPVAATLVAQGLLKLGEGALPHILVQLAIGSAAVFEILQLD